MADVWTDLFDTLLFGNGCWIGLIIIISIIILVTTKVKESSFLFLPISVFLAIQYYDNVGINSDFMWASIVMWFMVAWCLIVGAIGVKERT